MKVLRRFSTIVAVGLLSVVSLTFAGPALAGSDGQNATACTGVSSPFGVLNVIGYGGITGGYVDLRYSTGCGIAWGRVCAAALNGTKEIWAERTAPAGHTSTNTITAGNGSGCGNSNSTGSLAKYGYGLIDANCSNGGPLPDWGGGCAVRARGWIFWQPGGSGYQQNVGVTGSY